MIELSKEYIEGVLRERGMNKSEFATKIGVMRQNIDALMDAKKKDIALVEKMADAIGISFLDFIGYGKADENDVLVSGFIKVNGFIHEIGDKEELLQLVEKIKKM